MGDTNATLDSRVTSAAAAGEVAPLTSELASTPQQPLLIDGKGEPTTSSVSSPSPAVVRGELVDTAVKFLTNPKVRETPMEQKREFLTKKGLTAVEIDAALSKSGTPDSALIPAQSTQFVHQAQPGNAIGSVYPGGYAGPPSQQLYPAGYYPNQPGSYPPGGSFPQQNYGGGLPWVHQSARVSRLRDLANMAVIFGGFGYICYRGIRSYLRRFHGFKSSDEVRMELMEQSMCQLQDTTKFVTDSLSQLTEAIRDQQRTLETFVTGQMTGNNGGKNVETAVHDVQREIGIVKSLLLSRNQFPALPGFQKGEYVGGSDGRSVSGKVMNGHQQGTRTPTLPAWQLENGMDGAGRKVNENDSRDYAAAVVNGVSDGAGVGGFVGGGLDSDAGGSDEDDSPV